MWLRTRTHVVTPSHPRHMGRVAVIMPSQVACTSGIRGTYHGAVGGTGCPHGKTFFKGGIPSPKRYPRMFTKSLHVPILFKVACATTTSRFITLF